MLSLKRLSVRSLRSSSLKRQPTLLRVCAPSLRTVYLPMVDLSQRVLLGHGSSRRKARSINLVMCQVTSEFEHMICCTEADVREGQL
jgi:hypothetical protein